MINFSARHVDFPAFIDHSVSDWIVRVIESHACTSGDLNYLFCNDDDILEYNTAYLQHDYYTDIITFDYCICKVISGDLIISLDTVHSNSILFHTSFRHELLRVIIHGILHLLGFSDHSAEEKLKMRELENSDLNLYSTFH